MFLPSAHEKFATILFLPIGAQFALGIYLKLHIHEQSIRPWAVRVHGVVGQAYPIFGWTQMMFGAIAFRSYCRGDNLGQCLAHYLMVNIPLTPERSCSTNYRGVGLLLTESLWQFYWLLGRVGSNTVAVVQNGGTHGLLCCG